MVRLRSLRTRKNTTTRHIFPSWFICRHRCGLTDFLTFSNGKVIPKPDLKRINGRIQYYNQKMARQKEGGSNWKKNTKKTASMDKQEKQRSKRLLS